MLFKALQVCFGNVDIGYALILTDQFLNGLLAGGLFMLQRRFPGLPLDIRKSFQGQPENTAGSQLGRTDGQIHSPVFNFFLQGSPPPSIVFIGITSSCRWNPPPP